MLDIPATLDPPLIIYKKFIFLLQKKEQERSENDLGKN